MCSTLETSVNVSQLSWGKLECSEHLRFCDFVPAEQDCYKQTKVVLASIAVLIETSVMFKPCA